MTKLTTQHSASALLSYLNDKKILFNLPRSQELLEARYNNPEIEYKYRALMGFGALFSVNFFFAFLGLVLNLESALSFILTGVVLIITALFSSYKIGHSMESLKQCFLIQCIFMTMITGKALIITGVAISEPSTGWLYSFTILLLTISTYFIYKSSLDRFLSSGVLLISIYMNIFAYTNSDHQTIYLNIFYILQLVWIAFLLHHKTLKPIYLPILYALIISLSGSVLILSFDASIESLINKEVTYSFFLRGTLLVTLLGTIAWMSGDKKHLSTEPITTAFAASILLGLILPPGILFGMIALILGYGRHDRFLTLLGIAFITLFLIYFYYSLEATLLVKSSILLGSGILMLFARFYMQIRGWNKGDAS